VQNMKEKSFLIFVWCHLWNARVSLEGADTTSYSLNARKSLAKKSAMPFFRRPTSVQRA
jgi:hypothetical protein